jgi:hypothetical protein
MSDVIGFPGAGGELKHTSYTDNGGDLGVGTLDEGIQVIRLNDTDFLVVTPDGEQVHTRESLAEFAWLLTLFIDSEERFRPVNIKLVTCDY